MSAGGKRVADVLKERDARPRLKMHTVARHQVDYFDLDAFVKQVTGRDWEFAAAQECGNDTQHAFSVSLSSTGQIDDYDQRQIDAFLADDRGAYPHPQTMLDWLASQGHIPQGYYLVRVSW